MIDEEQVERFLVEGSWEGVTTVSSGARLRFAAIWGGGGLTQFEQWVYLVCSSFSRLTRSFEIAQHPKSANYDRLKASKFGHLGTRNTPFVEEMDRFSGDAVSLAFCKTACFLSLRFAASGKR